MRIIKILLILFTITIIGCDNNDDLQTNPITPTDGFTHNNVFFDTSNAYVEIDEEDDIDENGFPDEYNFFFSNGRMFDNDDNVNGSSGDYLLSLNTTNWVFFSLRIEDNQSLVSAAPIAGNTYVGAMEDSVILEGGQIDSLVNPYFINGVEFGIGNENVGTFNTPRDISLPGAQTPLLTINAIDLDVANPIASTIDVDYTFMNQTGEIITGHYEGTFGVVLD